MGNFIEKREFYRILVEQANECIIVLQDEFFVYANPKTSELLGLPINEILGKPFILFVHPDDRYLIVRRYNMKKNNENPPEYYTFRVLGKNGESHILLASVKVIQWKEKPALLYVLVDITKYKEVDSDLLSKLFQNQ